MVPSFEEFDTGDTDRYPVFAVQGILSSVQVFVLTGLGGPVSRNSILEVLVDTQFDVLGILTSVWILLLTVFLGPMLGNSILDILIDTQSLLHQKYLAQYRYLYLVY